VIGIRLDILLDILLGSHGLTVAFVASEAAGGDTGHRRTLPFSAEETDSNIRSNSCNIEYHSRGS
jgi:hypothetical protein